MLPFAAAGDVCTDEKKLVNGVLNTRHKPPPRPTGTEKQLQNFFWLQISYHDGVPMKKPELLAPAGNWEKLQIAIHYGADAVYLGGTSFGLRNLADNFTQSELTKAVNYAHERQVLVYLTLNAYPANADLPLLRRYLEEIAPIPFDAYIAADPGVIAMIREVSPDRAIHLSTQANTTNWMSARFWQEQGVERINLAREMSLDELREVRERVGVGLEAFVHGAMCISYSGRCILSSVMAGRYWRRQRSLELKMNVPVSSSTIGKYSPGRVSSTSA